MMTIFQRDYFAFIMGGTVEEFRTAADSLNAALSYGGTLEEAQKCMDTARDDAELLCVLFDSVPLQGTGTGDA